MSSGGGGVSTAAHLHRRSPGIRLLARVVDEECDDDDAAVAAAAAGSSSSSGALRVRLEVHSPHGAALAYAVPRPAGLPANFVINLAIPDDLHPAARIQGIIAQAAQNVTITSIVLRR